MNGTHLDDVEEFGDDGGYASEERRPALSLHLFSVPFHLDECALLLSYVLADTGWVHVLHSW